MVAFDTDGDDTVDQAVSYAYDAGGLRTQMILPGDLSVSYQYDARGQLVALTDWDDQTVKYAYDQAGRLIAATRQNGLRSRYQFDAGGRLRLLQHVAGGQTLGHFAYQVDALGNRVLALEALPHPGSGTTTLASDDGEVDYYRGSWSTDGSFETSTDFSAALRIAFFGDEADLTLKVGPDCSICDIYIDGSLWESFDNYAASAGEDEVAIPLLGDGPHVLDIRNRREKNRASTGYRLGFKQLVVEQPYDLHTIQYGYDALARLTDAGYYPGINTAASAFRQYDYSYDLAGNRTQRIVTVGGSPTETNTTYNAANQIASGGVTYDDAGRMTSDGTNAFTWDRADRLLTHQGVTSTYNGLGQRVSQTVSSITTEYLLDVQPGLWKVLAETTQGNTAHFVHGPRGIQAAEDPVGSWSWVVQDGLGSVRLQADADLVVDGVQHFAPYGVPFGGLGTFDAPFGFTGEQVDDNDLLYLRARQYAPGLGAFPSIDPIEGMIQEAMSLNKYSWVGGNPTNQTDPSGKWWWWNVNPVLEENAQVSYRTQAVAMAQGGSEFIHAEFIIPNTLYRIDLLDSELGLIWEIKPYEEAGLGNTFLQVTGYVGLMDIASRMNELEGYNPLNGIYYNWNGVLWLLGTNFNDGLPLFLGTDESGYWSYFAEQYSAGIIAWYKSRNEDEPVPDFPVIYVPYPMRRHSDEEQRNEREYPEYPRVPRRGPVYPYNEQPAYTASTCPSCHYDRTQRAGRPATEQEEQQMARDVLLVLTLGAGFCLAPELAPVSPFLKDILQSLGTQPVLQN